MIHLRTLALLLLLSTALTSGLRADTLTGEVRGTVLDVDGSVPLTAVQMTLISVDRGWRKQLKTDADGNFAFIQLEPGNYTVTAETPGYYPQEKTGVLIRLNQPKVVLPPFQLRKEVPTPTQRLTVQGEGGQTRTAVVDLTAPGPTPIVLAYLQEPGLTSLVDLLDWAIRANFGADLVEGLPLRGVRSFDQLALLSPGVARVPFSGGDGPAVGIGVGQAGQFAVNGLRGRSNNFTVDGSDNNDEDIGVRRQGFVALVPQSNESVQEFQITTAGFSAEFGRNTGSMVNAVSRSGTEKVHGQAYGIFGHDALNAGGYFDTPYRDTVNQGDLNGGSFSGDDSSQQLVGGVLGAPLAGDKLFFFGSVERQRERGSRPGHFVVPNQNERGLRHALGFTPIDELADFIRQRGLNYSDRAGRDVYSLYPLPNNPAGPFGGNTYTDTRPERGDGWVFSTKFDWYISAVHAFAARYNFTDDQSLIPFTGEAIHSTLATDTRTQNLSLFLNSTTPGFGNALRASYGRTNLGFPPDRGSPLIFGSAFPDPVPPALANFRPLQRTVRTNYGEFGPFGLTGPIGQLEIAPFSRIGVDVFNFPQGRIDNTFQVSDFVTFTRTSHTFKFGIDLRRSELNSFSDRNARPLMYFGYGRTACPTNSTSCLFSFDNQVMRGTDWAALGVPAAFLQTVSTQPEPNSAVALQFTQTDLFVQDEWRVHPRLNLNLGLRYELQSVPRDRRRRIENTFELTSGDFDRLPDDPGSNGNFDDALAGLRRFLGNRRRIYRRDSDNLAPRIGLAWDPQGRGNFVIRAGYSISYDAILGAVTSQSRNVFPTFIPVNLSPNSLCGRDRGLFCDLGGLLIPNISFLNFTLNDEFLIRPGTLNTFGVSPGAFATAIGALLNQGVLTIDGGRVRELSVNGLAFTLPEARPKNSSAQHFLLSVQKQWGRDFLTRFEFVGSRGSHLTRFTTPNGGLITSPIFLLSSNPFAVPIRDLSANRPEPALGAYRVFENSASSSYHSLQVSAEKRFSRGFEFRANWTWSHVIDGVSDPFDSRGFFSLPQNGSRLDLERASANFDARHRVALYWVWDLPGASVHPILARWRLAGIGEFQTGQPFTVNTALDQNLDGNLTDRLDTVEGLTLDPSSRRPVAINPGVDPNDLLAPFLANGRVGRNTFRSDGLATLDLALSRSFALGEQARLGFRLEVFNLLNSTQFGIPIRILESPGFGYAYDTQSSPRSLRFAVKLSF